MSEQSRCAEAWLDCAETPNILRLDGGSVGEAAGDVAAGVVFSDSCLANALLKIVGCRASARPLSQSRESRLLLLRPR